MMLIVFFLILVTSSCGLPMDDSPPVILLPGSTTKETYGVINFTKVLNELKKYNLSSTSNGLKKYKWVSARNKRVATQLCPAVTSLVLMPNGTYQVMFDPSASSKIVGFVPANYVRTDECKLDVEEMACFEESKSKCRTHMEKRTYASLSFVKGVASLAGTPSTYDVGIYCKCS